MHTLLLTFVIASSVGAGSPSRGQDGWPQFRGPDGQGHVAGTLPVSWSNKAQHAWSVPIPGKGWSSPVALDGQVWVTTAVELEGGGFSLRTLGLDQATGKIRHDIELFTIAKKPMLHARNGLATPTPVIETGRLYAHFGCYGTACVDTVSGRILWKNETLQLNHETGPASSPLLYRDRLICPCDGSDVQYAAALSTASGALLWKTARPAAAQKSPSSRRAFSTPLAISVDGKDQIVIPGAFCIYSYDPETGAEIWRVKSAGFSNVPRPVFAHGLVFVTSGFQPPELMAIRPDGQGDVTKTHVAWRYRKNIPNIPSPVIVGDHLIVISDPGTATCLDAKSGKMKWSERLGTTFSASPLAHDETVYVFGEDGKTVLFHAAEAYKELGRNELTGRVQATPAVAGACLFIRTETELHKIGP